MACEERSSPRYAGLLAIGKNAPNTSIEVVANHLHTGIKLVHPWEPYRLQGVGRVDEGPGDVADLAADFADADRRDGDFDGRIGGVVGVKRHGRVHCPCVDRGVVDHDVFACAILDIEAA